MLRSARPDDPTALAAVLESDGPWYVYGASVASAKSIVASLGLHHFTILAQFYYHETA